MTLSFAERMALVTTGLGLLHHMDHVLRFDHSGWPFRPEVTPFTYSLFVYPVIALVLALRGRPRVRVGLSVLLFLFPTLAHTFLETPVDQYHTWARLSQVNLLHVSAPGVGVAAVAIAFLLSLSALVTLIAFWREARHSPS
jgi:hypothetical protein